MRVDVVDAALDAAYGEGERPRIVALTAPGRRFDESVALELAAALSYHSRRAGRGHALFSRLRRV